MRHLQENIIGYFNESSLHLSNPGLVEVTPNHVNLRRNDDLDLELTIISAGWSNSEGPDIPAGNIYQSSNIIEFIDLSGSTFTGRGAIYRSHNAHSSANGTEQTTRRYFLNSIEMQSPGTSQASYVIEWVGNLSSSFFGMTISMLKTSKVQR